MGLAQLQRRGTFSHAAPQLIIQEALESIFFNHRDNTLKVGVCAEVVCPLGAVDVWGLSGQFQGTKTDLPKFARNFAS
eukprot:567132-Pelagomonas_calceolata.AAC.1